LCRCYKKIKCKRTCDAAESRPFICAMTPEDEQLLSVGRVCPSVCPMRGRYAWRLEAEWRICPSGVQEVALWRSDRLEERQNDCPVAGMVSCRAWGNGFCCDDRLWRWSVGDHPSEPAWRVGGWIGKVVVSQRMTEIVRQS
jgi:hypothetical protein